MPLTFRIVLLVSTAFVLLLAFLGVLVWHSWHRSGSSARWPLANLLYALALLLFALHAIVPDFIGVVGADALIVAAGILCLEATREFRGLRPSLPPLYVAGAFTILFVAYYCFAAPSVNARVVAMSAFLGIVEVSCAATLLRRNPLRGRIGITVASALFMLCAATQIARGAFSAFAPPLSDISAAPFANVVYFTAACLSVFCASIGWKVLNHESLIMVAADAEHTIRTASAREDLLARRAVAAETASSEVLAMVNLEVRNPLGGVVAMADLLLDSHLTSDQQECALAVRAEAQTLRAVNDNLLDLSALLSRKFELDSYPFDLAAAIDDVALAFAPIARRKRMALAIEYPVRLPRRFIGDGARIRQVITNLVAQAVKSTATGRILIAAAVDESDGAHRPVGVLVSGDPDFPVMFPARDLFRWEFTSESRTTEEFGISLEVSRKLIELMGGSLHFQHPEGQGVSFWFALPLQLEAPPLPEVSPR